MEVISRNIDIDHDLTQAGLCQLLNQKFGAKTFTTKEDGKKLYNLQDIEGYVRRGQLPRKLGGLKIEKIQVSSGVCFLRIEGIQKIKELPDVETPLDESLLN